MGLTNTERKGIQEHFTDREPGTDGRKGIYDTVEWEITDAVIPDYKNGGNAFEQTGVEFPKSWSLNARNIVSQKYFRGTLGTPERERSLKQVIERVVTTIAGWGRSDGYFDDYEATVFANELRWILLHQHAAFNSPVWFNIGVKGVPQQASACFILACEDNMNSILNWYREEGIIFKHGSGSGVNLSKLRSSKEGLQGGGTASGPVSFMRGADASAGTIKSGGKTRRAAKMVMLDVDHPDIEEFIWCKAIEERKARVLAEAGFDMDLDGKDAFSVQYQNANNSVRVTDEFMEAVQHNEIWPLLARDGTPIDASSAKQLLHQIAEAAWECADPGVQYDTTINRWHTCPTTGKINGSNPCSEYMHLDNSACNLASINLLKYLKDDGFDIAGFKHTVDVLITAMDILVGRADYPTEAIGDNARAFRQLGLGYANLGALLMAQGLPYDSDAGRAWAAAITALMTGQAYKRSTELAEKLGPFEGYGANNVDMLDVLAMHEGAALDIDESHVPPTLLFEATRVWSEVCDEAMAHGARNSQTTVLAPTGTIGLMMDCDTTGIEPDFALTKTKKLVGGGTMKIVNQTIPRALQHLGYNGNHRSIVDYIAANGTVVGAPHFNPEHTAVFATAIGDNAIPYMGHVRMMAAAQPFLSGAISKTVNMPREVTVEDVENLIVEGWRLGLKALAIYRDGCKVGQPLDSAKKAVDKVVETVIVQEPVRQKLPRRRKGYNQAFRINNTKGYLTVGEFEDGRPAEIFLKVAKNGSTLAGIMDAFAISVSHGLQYGVPLKAFCEMFMHHKFEPAGMTDDPDVRIANSLVDYIFRRLAIDYLDPVEREHLGILTTTERIEAVNGPAPQPQASSPTETELCHECGSVMQRAGSCHVCAACGSTSGCS